MKKEIKKQFILGILAISAVFLVLPNFVQAAQISPDSVLKLVNEAREKGGVEVLKENAKLVKAAKDKLNDMIENKYFAHTSPKGKSPWYWFGKNGYEYQYAGENLAISFTNAETQQKAWMKSPTHKKNIMNPNFLETGIAVGAGEIDGQMSIITVQEFGTLAGAAAPKPAGKSEAPITDKELMREENKIVPQVLSEKKTNPETVLGPQPRFQPVGFRPMDFINTLAMIFLAMSMVVSPIAFMALAFENIWLEHKMKKQMAV